MYIIFEGIDTSGKSTQIEKIQQKYDDIIVTKEPGGTHFGLKIRQMILNSEDKLHSKSEMLLFLADRAEHYARVVKPNSDKIILSDRGFISGMAYALCNDASLDMDFVLKLNRFALEDSLPSGVVFFKTNETLLKARLCKKEHDTIEQRGIAYLLKVQEKMEEIVEKLPTKTLILDASKSVEELFSEIERFIYDKSA